MSGGLLDNILDRVWRKSKIRPASIRTLGVEAAKTIGSSKATYYRRSTGVGMATSDARVNIGNITISPLPQGAG